MTLLNEAELLEIEINQAIESCDGYKFSDDPINIEFAVIMEDVQLLKAFLPVVGRWRMANLVAVKKMLERHGYADNYGQYLSDDCIATHVEFIGLVSSHRDFHYSTDLPELYVLAIVSNEDDRERLRYLVRERKIIDVAELKAALESMGNTAPPLYSGSL